MYKSTSFQSKCSSNHSYCFYNYAVTITFTHHAAWVSSTSATNWVNITRHPNTQKFQTFWYENESIIFIFCKAQLNWLKMLKHCIFLKFCFFDSTRNHIFLSYCFKNGTRRVEREEANVTALSTLMASSTWLAYVEVKRNFAPAKLVVSMGRTQWMRSDAFWSSL